MRQCVHLGAAFELLQAVPRPTILHRHQSVLDHVAKFQDMLHEYFCHEKHLVSSILPDSDYRDHMGMSGVYLSDLLKEETGIGAQDHIHHFGITKAKNHLLHLNDRVGSIAYSQGLEYPRHFSKVLKAKTGMSPGQFRKDG